MAQLSDLVRAIAAVTGMEETQVGWIARHLREEGLISQGGRGRGAAQMSVSDAANLIIGTACLGSAKTFAQQVRLYRAARFNFGRVALGQEYQEKFSAGASFGDALEFLISRAVPNNEGSQLSQLVWDLLLHTSLTDVHHSEWEANLEANRSKIGSIVDTRISLYHPYGSAAIVFQYDKGVSFLERPSDFEFDVFLRANFAAVGEIENRDRVVRTSISIVTILEVGKVLAS